jgi:hypothetical protein
LHPWSERAHAARRADQKSLETASEILKDSQRLFSKEEEGVMGRMRNLAASWWTPLTSGANVAQGKYT